MSRIRRLSISSLFSRRGESDCEDTPTSNTAPDTAFNTAPKTSSKPAPKATSFSARIKAHLKGLLSVKSPDVPEKKTAVHVQVDPPTKEAVYLATLDSLPPLSPTGFRYAVESQQGNVTFAHFAGEEYSRWLHDGLPGYEELVGEEEAYKALRRIEIQRDADYAELHDLLMPGNLWHTSDRWDPAETRYVSRHPYAIRTTGVVVVKRRRSTTTSPETCSPTKVHKRANSSPDVLQTLGKSADAVVDSGPSNTFVKMSQSSIDDYDEEDVRMLKEKGHVKLFESIPSHFEGLIILDPYKG